MVDGDLVLRSAGSESIGRLSSLSGTNYLATNVGYVPDPAGILTAIQVTCFYVLTKSF